MAAPLIEYVGPVIEQLPKPDWENMSEVEASALWDMIEKISTDFPTPVNPRPRALKPKDPVKTCSSTASASSSVVPGASTASASSSAGVRLRSGELASETSADEFAKQVAMLTEMCAGVEFS